MLYWYNYVWLIFWLLYVDNATLQSELVHFIRSVLAVDHPKYACQLRTSLLIIKVKIMIIIMWSNNVYHVNVLGGNNKESFQNFFRTTTSCKSVLNVVNLSHFLSLIIHRFLQTHPLFWHCLIMTLKRLLNN